jgi:hypothetical protein
VISWFQSLLFQTGKLVPLRIGIGTNDKGERRYCLAEIAEVGRYTLTPPDPQLKGACFQPLHLSSENPVSKIASQIQLAPLRRGGGGQARALHPQRLRGGGLFKLNSVDP